VVAMCALARAAEMKMNKKLVFILLVAAHQTYSPYQIGILLTAVTGNVIYVYTYTYVLHEV
jgi:hypothetical protein